ncbi:Ribonuclease H-like protein [Gracilaria domingensis]|nr:Ribonuclease H-like protein [Gracilaria domingensis]
MGCISHKLNRAMRHAMEEQITKKTIIATNLESVKTIVRSFRQGNWNLLLPSGSALTQEIEARFGTTFNVVQRFLFSSKHVVSIISAKDLEPAKVAFDSLLTETNSKGDVNYPALDAIVECFRPVCHVERQLEAQKSPTMYLILPMLEKLEIQLKQIAGGMAKGRVYQVPHVLSQQFASRVLHFLSSIEVHSMWIAGRLLHPRMRSLGFVKDCSKRNLYKGKGSILIHRLLKNYENKHKSAEVCVVNEAIARNDLGKDKFCLSEMFEIAESGVGDEDAFDKYMGRKFSAPALHKMRAVKKESDHGDNLVNFLD